MVTGKQNNPIPDMQTIRVARAVKGWSQRRLAEGAGMRPWRLWRLEAGYSEPHSDELVALWNALCIEK